MTSLEYKNKFNLNNPRKIDTIKEQEFFRWTSNHFYRTSYNDMRSSVCNLFHIWEKFLMPYYRALWIERTVWSLATRALSQAWRMELTLQRGTQKTPVKALPKKNLTIKYRSSPQQGKKTRPFISDHPSFSSYAFWNRFNAGKIPRQDDTLHAVS